MNQRVKTKDLPTILGPHILRGVPDSELEVVRTVVDCSECNRKFILADVPTDLCDSCYFQSDRLFPNGISEK